MWGALISLAGQAVSGIASAVNNRRMQRERDAEYARQVADAEARAAENPLSRSENQAIINQYDMMAKQRMQTAENMGTIMGWTPEARTAQQQAESEGRAQLLSNISASASERADKYRDKAEASRQAHAASVREDRAARNQTYANLAANAANAFGSIVDSYTNVPSFGSNGNTPKASGPKSIVTETSPVTSGGQAKLATKSVTPHMLVPGRDTGTFNGQTPGENGIPASILPDNRYITTSYRTTGTGLNPTPVVADTSGLKLNMPQYQPYKR